MNTQPTQHYNIDSIKYVLFSPPYKQELNFNFLLLYWSNIDPTSLSIMQNQSIFHNEGPSQTINFSIDDELRDSKDSKRFLISFNLIAVLTNMASYLNDTARKWQHHLNPPLPQVLFQCPQTWQHCFSGTALGSLY